uniref:Reverse transcriptase zinc-binding domain-containing protein n=1 Tax=Aegilops tauschii subsp. strangulata TaxID=200361 RepID=A0A452XQ96_AEGTS
ERDNWIPRQAGLKAEKFTRRSRLRWVNQLIHSDRNEWNVELINQMFPAFDANEICRIKLPTRKTEDCIAWHAERSGIFSVKSAYRLATRIKQRDNVPASSSSCAADGRSIWNLIWKSNVPQKVKVTGWRIATESVATKQNKMHRTLEKMARCSICGLEDENEYHAVIACTKARALRSELRKFWHLPSENRFCYTGNDWLLVLLDACDETTRARILLLIWRAWHLRNNCVHEGGKASISVSVDFLVKYEQELSQCMGVKESIYG